MNTRDENFQACVKHYKEIYPDRSSMDINFACSKIADDMEEIKAEKKQKPAENQKTYPANPEIKTPSSIPVNLRFVNKWRTND